MKKILILGLVVVALSLIAVSATNAETAFNDATCQQFKTPWGSGYSCREDSGTIRSFHNPGAYENMNAYYTATPEPGKIEQFVPTSTYLYVTGGATSTYN